MTAKVTENIAERRFEMPIGPGAIAAAYYREEDGRVFLIHTEVPSEYSGQGLASKLAAGTFKIIRQSGRRSVLKCQFMAAYFVRHPEIADIVDG